MLSIRYIDNTYTIMCLTETNITHLITPFHHISSLLPDEMLSPPDKETHMEKNECSILNDAQLSITLDSTLNSEKSLSKEFMTGVSLLHNTDGWEEHDREEMTSVNNQDREKLAAAVDHINEVSVKDCNGGNMFVKGNIQDQVFVNVDSQHNNTDIIPDRVSMSTTMSPPHDMSHDCKSSIATGKSVSTASVGIQTSPERPTLRDQSTQIELQVPLPVRDQETQCYIPDSINYVYGSTTQEAVIDAQIDCVFSSQNMEEAHRIICRFSTAPSDTSHIPETHPQLDENLNAHTSINDEPNSTEDDTFVSAETSHIIRESLVGLDSTNENCEQNRSMDFVDEAFVSTEPEDLHRNSGRQVQQGHPQIIHQVVTASEQLSKDCAVIQTEANTFDMDAIVPDSVPSTSFTQFRESPIILDEDDSKPLVSDEDSISYSPISDTLDESLNDLFAVEDETMKVENSHSASTHVKQSESETLVLLRQSDEYDRSLSMKDSGFLECMKQDFSTCVEENAQEDTRVNKPSKEIVYSLKTLCKLVLETVSCSSRMDSIKFEGQRQSQDRECSPISMNDTQLQSQSSMKYQHKHSDLVFGKDNVKNDYLKVPHVCSSNLVRRSTNLRGKKFQPPLQTNVPTTADPSSLLHPDNEISSKNSRRPPKRLSTRYPLRSK